jgi:NifB/MoaA-like Fe-S oxidoreductase
VAAVPVGLTRYRAGLFPLKSYDRASSKAVLDVFEEFGARFLQAHGTRLFYAADEFYLKAGQDVPSAGYYEDFPQLENGVGMWALFKDDFSAALSAFSENHKNKIIGQAKTVSVATGLAAAPLLKEMAKKLEEARAGLTVQVFPIENRFFGGGVDVAGLLTGQDFVSQLSGRSLGDELLIPASSLRREKDLFLDDMTRAELEVALRIPVTAVPGNGGAFLSAVLGEYIKC